MTGLQEAEGYAGPERRRHLVFVTHNTEYHCRDGVCVAVRERNTGQFIPGHAAIGRRPVKRSPSIAEGLRVLDTVQLGERLMLSGEDTDVNVVTSAIRGIARPAKEIIARYPG